MSTTITQSQWHDIGTIDQIPTLGARVIERQQGNIAVFKMTTGEILAVLDQCPHKGGPLSQGMMFGDQVSCPLHQWTINLRTGKAQEPDEGCTARFNTKVVNNRVYIEIHH